MEGRKADNGVMTLSSNSGNKGQKIQRSFPVSGEVKPSAAREAPAPGTALDGQSSRADRLMEEIVSEENMKKAVK